MKDPTCFLCEEWADTYKCVYCDQPHKRHLRGKCLFEAHEVEFNAVTRLHLREHHVRCKRCGIGVEKHQKLKVIGGKHGRHRVIGHCRKLKIDKYWVRNEKLWAARPEDKLELADYRKTIWEMYPLVVSEGPDQ